MSGDTFTSNRFRWLEAIAADKNLKASAIRVAVVISSHMNRQSGKAFPSIKTIAAKCATPERTVKYAIGELCEYGYLDRKRGGFSKSNIYEIAGIATVDEDSLPVSSEATDCPTDHDSGAMDCPNDGSIGAMDCPSVGQWVAPRSGNGLPPNPLKEPFEKEPSEKNIFIAPSASLAHERKGKAMSKPDSSEADAAFGEFWEAYPRKDDKLKARKAWAKAVKIADAAAIIAGAKRYAEMRSGQDSQFTKLPASFLNAGAWENEAVVSLPVDARPIGIRSSAKERTGAAILHMLSNDVDAA